MLSTREDGSDKSVVDRSVRPQGAAHDERQLAVRQQPSEVLPQALDVLLLRRRGGRRHQLLAYLERGLHGGRWARAPLERCGWCVSRELRVAVRAPPRGEGQERSR